ncbi:hypothetical protein [Aeromicrobium sp. UC242_57]|uniref:hypothetical protein n=1 Tax=Aeromicrobium sp. UC242_57 TaxID=3374624 RepID=UPI00378A153C
MVQELVVEPRLDVEPPRPLERQDVEGTATGRCERCRGEGTGDAVGDVEGTDEGYLDACAAYCGQGSGGALNDGAMSLL